MSWKHTIDIKAAWQQAENAEISANELAKVLSERLRECPVEEAAAHADLFESLAQREDLTDELFDAAFSDMYDWADDNRVWIATTF